MTNDLKPDLAEVHMSVSVTRAATGLVETFELVGHVIDSPEINEPNETERGTQCPQQ